MKLPSDPLFLLRNLLFLLIFFFKHHTTSNQPFDVSCMYHVSRHACILLECKLSASPMRNQYLIHHLLGLLNEYRPHSFHTFFFLFSFLKLARDNNEYICCTFVCEWSLALSAGLMQLSSIAQWGHRRSGGIHKFRQDSLDHHTSRADHLPAHPS